MAGSRALALLFAPTGADRSPPVFGLHPVERTVLAFMRAGVRDFLLFGDPGATAALSATIRAGRCREARVGIAGSPAQLRRVLEPGGPAYVARADYVYDRRLVARFVEDAGGAPANVAAVDFRSDALASQEGAPRTAGWGEGVPGESLRVAQRGLVAPAGVLIGLGRVTPSFARALQDAPPGERSFECAWTLLAGREPVATWAVHGLWQAVRTQPPVRDADLRVARRKVLAGAVGVEDGVIARHLNRPLSRRITERLLSRRVAPWQVSVASFLLTLTAGASFAVGHAATGGLVAQMASILAGVDDEIARVRYEDSPFGSVYDALLDRVGDAALIGGMTFYAWLMGAGGSAVALGFAAVAGSSLSMLVKEKYGAQYRRPYATEREGRWGWLLLGRDGRLFLALIAGLTGYVEAVLAYLAVGTHLHAGARIYRIRSEAMRPA